MDGYRRRAAGLLLSFCVAVGCGDDGGDNSIVSITVEPAAADATAINGISDPVAFRAIATFADGSSGEVAATWSIDLPALGDLDADSGKFTATGALGGEGIVTATVDDLTADGRVTVDVLVDVFDASAPANPSALFDEAPPFDQAESPVALYPLDGAVIPRWLRPIDVQWSGGVVGETFRIEATTTYAQVRIYLAAPDATFEFARTIPDPQWTLLKDSGDGPISIVVDRAAAGGGSFRSQPVALQPVEARTFGTIYYWQLEAGRLGKIGPDGPEPFMPTPPKRLADNEDCISCHAITRDGRTMAVKLWAEPEGDFSAIFDLTADLSTDPPPARVAPDTYTAQFSTFNADGSRLLVNSNMALALVDPATGEQIGDPAMQGLPLTGVAHPEWAPDGSFVALIANLNVGATTIDFTTGDLVIMDAMAGDQFGPLQTVRASAGFANAYPSISPDSTLIAYGRGQNSRGKTPTQELPGNINLVPAMPGAGEIVLTNASAGDNTYQPAFSPHDEGGYLFIAFYTMRDYGNAQRGTAGTRRRQIWVTAIDRNAPAGSDPSGVPFWLPGQDTQSENMGVRWTVTP